jgi:hypothetical protein
MIPRVPPYTAAGWKTLACVTDSWADGDPLDETKWYHMLNIVPPDWQGQEYPDIFDVVQGKVKQPKPPRRRKVKVRQASLEEAFA